MNTTNGKHWQWLERDPKSSLHSFLSRAAASEHERSTGLPSAMIR